jgi:hypothetical protein
LGFDPQLVGSWAAFWYFQHFLNHEIYNRLSDAVLIPKHTKEPPVVFLYNVQ